MIERGLETFFDVFLRKESVFFDKRVIQSMYIPDTILHREEQTKQIANIIAPALRQEKPSNVFIYGRTGTGKTLTAKYTTQKEFSYFISKFNLIFKKIEKEKYFNQNSNTNN